MVSFKLAAVKVLREAKEPLHYEEITRHASEQNLIEFILCSQTARFSISRGRFKILFPSSKVLEKLNILLQTINNKNQANDEQSRTFAAIRDTFLLKPMSGNIRIISEKRSSEEMLQC